MDEIGTGSSPDIRIGSSPFMRNGSSPLIRTGSSYIGGMRTGSSNSKVGSSGCASGSQQHSPSPLFQSPSS